MEQFYDKHLSDLANSVIIVTDALQHSTIMVAKKGKCYFGTLAMVAKCNQPFAVVIL